MVYIYINLSDSIIIGQLLYLKCSIPRVKICSQWGKCFKIPNLYSTNIYQSNTCRKDLSLLHLEGEPRI